MTVKESKERLADLPEYRHVDYKGREAHYRPKLDAKAWRGKKHGDFYITYSIPKRGRSVVASIWIEPKSDAGHGVKMRLHVDIDKMVGPLLEGYLSKDFQKISESWLSWQHSRYTEFIEAHD